MLQSKNISENCPIVVYAHKICKHVSWKTLIRSLLFQFLAQIIPTQFIYNILALLKNGSHSDVDIE